MEMVATAKMRKAIDAVLSTRTYANLSWETVLHLANKDKHSGEILHPLLTPKEKVNKVAIILVTSNRGMCGAYNTAIINKAKDSIKKHSQVPTEFILIGKKGEILYNQKYTIAADFPKHDLVSNEAEVEPIVNLIMKDFLSGKYDKVLVAYTDFVSPLEQVPRVKQLLPINIETEDEYLGIVADPKIRVDKDLVSSKSDKHLNKESGQDYIFEPSPEEVLNRMLPRLLAIQIYQALLEANASEHSAWMSAMHQATEAASDMIEELTLYYNKVRQAGITAEIAEISAGANALAE